MSPLDALYAFEDLRARMLIPIHHGAFALSYERLDEPARWLVELARQRGVRDHVLVMTAGQTERFVQPRPGERERA
jgi:L-ascorbate metabolism protein UlaG (beta-lactamase superfamily)